jgi:hypothetical protein
LFFSFLVTENGWLAAVPPCVGFAGWLFGGMDSKPLLAVGFISSLIFVQSFFLHCHFQGQVHMIFGNAALPSQVEYF